MEKKTGLGKEIRLWGVAMEITFDMLGDYFPPDPEPYQEPKSTPIPEPTTLLMVGVGLLVLAWRMR